MAYKSLILMVCSANICRSPMAEYLLRRLIHQAGDDGRLMVASAGTWALVNRPASPEARQLLLEDGLDPTPHRARNLNQQDIDQAALVLVMTKAHREDIQQRFLRTNDKVYLLTEMVGKSHDINDPYGGNLEDYQRCKAEIEAILAEGYQRIVDLALHRRSLRWPKLRWPWA
jgi:protein-tyrosine-phosphatase